MFLDLPRMNNLLAVFLARPEMNNVHVSVFVMVTPRRVIFLVGDNSSFIKKRGV